MKKLGILVPEKRSGINLSKVVRLESDTLARCHQYNRTSDFLLLLTSKSQHVTETG